MERAGNEEEPQPLPAEAPRVLMERTLRAANRRVNVVTAAHPAVHKSVCCSWRRDAAGDSRLGSADSDQL